MFRFYLSIPAEEMVRWVGNCVEVSNIAIRVMKMIHPQVSGCGLFLALWLSRWHLCIEVGLSQSSAVESYTTRHLLSASGTGCRDQD